VRFNPYKTLTKQLNQNLMNNHLIKSILVILFLSWYISYIYINISYIDKFGALFFLFLYFVISAIIWLGVVFYKGEHLLGTLFVLLFGIIYFLSIGVPIKLEPKVFDIYVIPCFFIVSAIYLLYFLKKFN
jgi:hypothetical protein